MGFIDFWKKDFTKPGESIHSAKWDSCVQQVADNNPKANAYAVCTAQLGEESFKSQFKDLAYTKSEINKARKIIKMDIDSAGPVPNSLLAEQDLEDETKKSVTDVTNKLKAVEEESEEMVGLEGAQGMRSRMKSLQIERQKKEIMTRKSFKQFWADINKQELWTCSQCGTKNREGEEECNECGHKR